MRDEDTEDQYLDHAANIAAEHRLVVAHYGLYFCLIGAITLATLVIAGGV